MLLLSDGPKARNFPLANTALIVANVAVSIFYELPHLNRSIVHASFYPCAVNHSCHAPEPWGVSWITVRVLVALGLTSSGRVRPQDYDAALSAAF